MRRRARIRAGIALGRLLLLWVAWALALSLVLGGKPWQFPDAGRFLISQ